MKKKILIGIGLMITILSIIGFSYAAWTITKEQTGMNKINSSCFKLSLEKEENVIGLKNTFPIKDEEGMNHTPYTFRVTNTCDLFASYTVSLEILKGSTMPISYIKALINNEKIENLNEFESTEKVESDSIDSKVLMRGTLGSGDSDDYNLRLWMDEKVTTSMEGSMNTSLKAKIVITGSVSNYNPVDAGITKLNDAILANEYQTSVEIAKEKIHNKQTPDFSKTAPIIDWQESHGTNQTITTTNTENYIGTSYEFDKETGYYTLKDYGTNNDYKWYTDIPNEEYQRNNYYTCVGAQTKKEDGTYGYSRPIRCSTMYKIVSTEEYEEEGEKKNRLTGYVYSQTELESDKSDKGLYETEDDNGTSYYYRGSVKNNNVYFGGFYWQIVRINGDGSIRLLYNGTVPNAGGANKRVGSSAFNENKNNPAYVGYMYGSNIGISYEENLKNEVDSTIKTKLDSWYKTNIVDNNLEKYIADAGFCSDRSLSTASNNLGDGFQTDRDTYYAPSKRVSDHTPTLLCKNKENDLFTLKSNEFGNHALSYPIGFITIDEALYAGMVQSSVNSLFYLINKNMQFWTMSPIRFDKSFGSMVFTVGAKGYSVYTEVSRESDMRPVINLSSDVKITKGIGSMSDPFVIKTEK